MSLIKIVAIVLIVGGVLGLIYGSVTYTRKSHSTELGALELAVNEKKTVNIPIWAGAGAVAIGSAILLFGMKRS